ncbi:hypothetical protein ACOMHN_054365 [Nucella lapillus]
MALRMCLTLFCFATALYVISGAPSFTERRSSRDLDKIHELEGVEESDPSSSTGGDNSKGDVSSQLRDVSRLQSGTEAQMTSSRQKEVQALAKALSLRDSKSDVHELAETLNELLRQSMPDRQRSGQANSAGEYLSDKHNPSEQRAQKYIEKTEKTKTEEGEEEEEKEESQKERLETIYNMLANLYQEQQGEEEATSKPGYSGHAADRDTPSWDTAQDVRVHEGHFGEFAGE